MLLSRLCADEFGVLWRYFIDSSAGDDDGAAPENIDSMRIELAAVVTERARRELCRPALVSDVRSLQRHTDNRSVDLANQMAIKFADQTKQIADQTNQISDLQRSTQMLVEQNQQMQEQMRQMHALLMTREGIESADVDKSDKRTVKRRRTGR
jgi:hypothetical protein